MCIGNSCFSPDLAQVASRERDVDVARHEVQSLASTMEGTVEHDKESLRREQQRLGREAVRMDAMQNALLSDLQDLRTQVCTWAWS